MDVLSAPAAWFGALFHPQSLVELRAIRADAEPKVSVEWIRAKDIGTEGVSGLLQRWTEQGRNIYAGVNPRSKRDGTAKGVDHARALFVDLDGWTEEEARALPSKAKLPPFSLLVSSGHGYHGYWILPEPLLDLGLWTRYQLALISLCGSDPCIHDPPRIMRIPGTVNFKSNPPSPCVLLETGPIAPPVAEWITPADEKALHSETILPRTGSNTGWRGGLSRASMAYLLTGGTTPEGERNKRLFDAACDAAGNGCDFSEGMQVFGALASASGLGAEEAETTIRSAFGKARSPARPASSGLVAYSAYVVGSDQEPEPKAEETKARPVLSNISLRRVEDEKTKKGKAEAVYKPIRQIVEEINEASGNWPRLASGNLFVLRNAAASKDGLPAANLIWGLDNADSLSAWMHGVGDVRWASGKNAPKNASGETVSPVSKREVWEHLAANAEPRYRSISTLPHEPPMPGIFYLPCVLPPATGERLAELVGKYNAASEEDRELLLAATVTPAWGGDPGRRPPFVLCSRFGRGTGKTSTVQVIGEMLWGGVLTIKKGEAWEKVVGRLLAVDGLATRVVLMDNVKGKTGGEEIEGLITSRTIDGWRPHVGQASRPNDLTYFYTSNSPRLTPDLAMRAVVIEIGRPHHETAFIQWASAFITEHRAQLIADCLGILSGSALSEISAENRDRWQDWQDSVLCRCSRSADRLARLIRERRALVDDDQETAERVSEAIGAYLRGLAKRGIPTQGTIKITRNEMRELLIKQKIVPESWDTNRVTNWVAKFSGQPGALAGLENQRARTEGERARFWIWSQSGSDSPGDTTGDDDAVDGIPV